MSGSVIAQQETKLPVPKPSAPARRAVMLDEVRQRHSASIIEVAGTIQLGLASWSLAPVREAAAARSEEGRPAVPPALTGTAAAGPNIDYGYRRIAMEVLVAVLEQQRGLGPGGAEAERIVVLRVVACRRLLLELRRQVTELGLEGAILVGEVPVSQGGRLEEALLAGLSTGGGVVDIVSDASKGRGSTVGLGWVVAAGEGGSFRTGTGTSACSNILHAELKAMRKGIRLALSLHPVLRRGIGTLRVFSDSRDGLALLRRGLAGDIAPGTLAVIQGEVLRICALLEGASAELCWVKGHAGDPLNELADRLAVSARRCHEAGLDAVQKAALRASIERDAPAAVKLHAQCHFRLAA